jgi:uncharacterized protein (DUF427 family)
MSGPTYYGGTGDEMGEKRIAIPGPEHPIAIERNPRRVIVRLGATVLADSPDALVLREAGYGAVHYIPRKDVDMALLERTNHATYCPYKGDASYFSIPSGGDRTKNAVWSYEAPYQAVAAIRDHLAFYADRIEISETAAPAEALPR